MRKTNTQYRNLGRVRTLAALSLGAFFLLLTVGPRIPLAIEIGRRVDLRLHEILFVGMLLVGIYFLINQGQFVSLRSPWYPFFGLSFIIVSLSLSLKVITTSSNLLMGLGYSYRALIFFFMSVVVANIAIRAGSGTTTIVIPTILLAFILNSVHVIWHSVHGSKTLFADNTGTLVQLYSPGLVGEPNALAAGIFFIYILTVLVQWHSTSMRQNLLIFLGLIVTLVCIYSINNRSAMVMAAMALVILIGTSLARRELKKAFFACVLLLTGLFSFFAVNPRGSAEGPIDALSNGRWPQWERALDLIQVDPVLGWELGTNEAHQAFLRLWGDWGLVGGLLFIVLLISMLIRSPGRETTDLIDGGLWVRVLKMFIIVLLVGGLLTDSMTPVISWDLLSFSVGLAWATWGANKAAQKMPGETKVFNVR